MSSHTSPSPNSFRSLIDLKTSPAWRACQRLNAVGFEKLLKTWALAALTVDFSASYGLLKLGIISGNNFAKRGEQAKGRSEARLDRAWRQRNRVRNSGPV